MSSSRVRFLQSVTRFHEPVNDFSLINSVGLQRAVQQTVTRDYIINHIPAPSSSWAALHAQECRRGCIFRMPTLRGEHRQGLYTNAVCRASPRWGGEGSGGERRGGEGAAGRSQRGNTEYRSPCKRGSELLNGLNWTYASAPLRQSRISPRMHPEPLSRGHFSPCCKPTRVLTGLSSHVEHLHTVGLASLDEAINVNMPPQRKLRTGLLPQPPTPPEIKGLNMHIFKPNAPTETEMKFHQNHYVKHLCFHCDKNVYDFLHT